jgi:hypothetical protein
MQIGLDICCHGKEQKRDGNISNIAQDLEGQQLPREGPFVRLISVTLLSTFVLVLAVAPSRATIINFADQPAGPSTFGAAGPAQTLVYEVGGITITFTGGVILTNETNQSTDFANVYATASFGATSLTNPLTVTFSQPIHNFQIDILNALAGNYIISDNAGNSMDFSLATTGGSVATEGFAATGTVVTIDYIGPGVSGATFDFAIGDVLFNQPLSTSTPEPASVAMLGIGLLALSIRSRKRFRCFAPEQVAIKMPNAAA